MLTLSIQNVKRLTNYLDYIPLNNTMFLDITYKLSIFIDQVLHGSYLTSF